jgi:hypothetical protein
MEVIKPNIHQDIISKVIDLSSEIKDPELISKFLVKLSRCKFQDGCNDGNITILCNNNVIIQSHSIILKFYMDLFKQFYCMKFYMYDYDIKLIDLINLHYHNYEKIELDCSLFDFDDIMNLLYRIYGEKKFVINDSENIFDFYDLCDYVQMDNTNILEEYTNLFVTKNLSNNTNFAKYMNIYITQYTKLQNPYILKIIAIIHEYYRCQFASIYYNHVINNNSCKCEICEIYKNKIITELKDFINNFHDHKIDDLLVKYKNN